jgi:hypothetical protein
MMSALERCSPATLRARGETIDRQRLEIEVLLAPLVGRGSVQSRILGLFQPLGGEALLRGRPLVRLMVMGLYPPLAESVQPGSGPRLRLVTSDD